MASPDIGRHGSAWAIMYRHTARDANSSGDQERGRQIRERLVCEYQANALVNALVLTMTGAMVVNPEFDVPASDPAFRVYMYACALSTVLMSLGLVLDCTLLYQLNMLMDEDVKEFIILLAQLRIPGVFSPTGLPDYLIFMEGLGFVCFYVAICAALHMLCEPVDAWVLTALFLGLVYVPFQVIAIVMDNWKWSLLKRKDAPQQIRRSGAAEEPSMS